MLAYPKSMQSKEISYIAHDRVAIIFFIIVINIEGGFYDLVK